MMLISSQVQFILVPSPTSALSKSMITISPPLSTVNPPEAWKLFFVPHRPSLWFSECLRPHWNHFLWRPVHPQLRQDVMPPPPPSQRAWITRWRMGCRVVTSLEQESYGWAKLFIGTRAEWKCEGEKKLTLSEGLIWTQASVCPYLLSIMMWVSEGLLYSDLSPQIVALVCLQNHCFANCSPNLTFQRLIVMEPVGWMLVSALDF